MSVPDWLRDLLAHVTKETDLPRLLDDLAALAALQAEALEKEMCRCLQPLFKLYEHPEWRCLRCKAIKAGEDFKKQYE